MELAVDNPHGLKPVFAVALPKRREDTMEGVVEYPFTERQPKPVLEAVGFVLGRVELELHAAMYVIHI
jgi:hypothetical protein